MSHACMRCEHVHAAHLYVFEVVLSFSAFPSHDRSDEGSRRGGGGGDPGRDQW